MFGPQMVRPVVAPFLHHLPRPSSVNGTLVGMTIRLSFAAAGFWNNVSLSLLEVIMIAAIAPRIEQRPAFRGSTTPANKSDGPDAGRESEPPRTCWVCRAVKKRVSGYRCPFCDCHRDEFTGV